MVLEASSSKQEAAASFSQKVGEAMQEEVASLRLKYYGYTFTEAGLNCIFLKASPPMCTWYQKQHIKNACYIVVLKIRLCKNCLGFAYRICFAFGIKHVIGIESTLSHYFQVEYLIKLKGL